MWVKKIEIVVHFLLVGRVSGFLKETKSDIDNQLTDVRQEIY